MLGIKAVVIATVYYRNKVAHFRKAIDYDYNSVVVESP